MTISISDKLIFFGAGCGVGLILGTLLTPRSGQEARQNLTSKGADVTRKVQSQIHRTGIPNVASFARQRAPRELSPERLKYHEPIDDADLSER